jgi:glycosyltransferase involved in cell wall biosynthesis
MRVCLLAADSYHTDPRLALEARGLAEAGHDVIVVCRGAATDFGRELTNGIDVDRLPVDASPFDTDGVPRGLGYAATTTQSDWASGVRRIDKEGSLDAICVRGFPLAKTGLAVGDDLDVPVALDFAADPIETIASRRAATGVRALAGTPGSLAARSLTPIRRLRRLESTCVSRADRLVVASEEARARYVRERDVPSERVRVVRSTVALDRFDAARSDDPARLESWAVDSPDDPTDATLDTDADSAAFTVAAPGPFVPDRGFEALLDAVAHLDSAVTDARLLLVGDGPDRYVSTLREHASDAGIETRIRVVPSGFLPAALDRADATVLPYSRSAFAATALPHALLASFAAGTPAVVGDVPPLRRVLTRADAGLVTTDAATDIAAALRVLGRDPDRARTLGANGREASEPGGPFDAARDRAAAAGLFDER